MSEAMIADIDDINFQALVVEASIRIPVLVIFWHPSNPESQENVELWMSLAEKYSGKFIVGKLNIEDQVMLASQFSVDDNSLPYAKLIRNGAAHGIINETMTEELCEKFIQPHIDNEIDNLRDVAKQLIQQGDYDKAFDALKEANRLEPENYNILFDMIDYYLKMGKPENAREIFDGLGEHIQQSVHGKQIAAVFYFSELANQGPDIQTVQKTLQEKGVQSSEGLEALFQLSSILILHGQEDAGAEALTKILQISQTVPNDIKPKAAESFRKLIAIFELKAPEKAPDYRRQMQNLLF
ncbi:tetratricopeptide repeat protein [Thiomicrorhabdus indica]|uniref:tetratricopeptide repeat protein n=1 Tax=Thiomicrorhabdus indica TaxID=2267253 RepID=UPI002AA6EA49|nr:tetratricopeptide repeat protein [Thiomicrorhabdus indica]